MASHTAYRTIWRWHFYAGLFVLPFILILSVTGAIYLFKPQIDRWEERGFRDLPVAGAVPPDAQLVAARSALPQASFQAYRVPAHPDEAAMVQMGLPGGALREVYVSPQGRILGALNPEARISAVVASIHGSLLLGEWGDRLVELAASWTIVMILTGLYLWWPRPFRAAGTLFPRLGLHGRPLLRDLHRVTGFWIAGLMLVMLASGLPWAGTWGSVFAWARGELGLVQGPQDWKIGAQGHDHHAAPVAANTSGVWLTAPAHAHNGEDHSTTDAHAGHAMPAATTAALPLSAFVARARAEGLAFPALVLPPQAPQRFGPPTGNVWTAKSEARDPRLRTTITYEPVTGRKLSETGFADKHPIDRAVNYGIAWHEGHLFGVPNQIVGLLTALALIALSVIGVMMWLARKPAGRMGAPSSDAGRWRPGLVAIVVVLALLLPLFGASLILIWVVDRVVSRVSPPRNRVPVTR